MNAEILKKTIANTRDSYISNGLAQDASQINNGLCEQFAEDVIENIGLPKQQTIINIYEYANFTGKPNDELATEVFHDEMLEHAGINIPDGLTIQNLNDSGLGDFGAHYFIEFNGKYYDAECHDGASTPFLLPLAINRFIECGIIGDLNEALQNTMPKHHEHSISPW